MIFSRARGNAGRHSAEGSGKGGRHARRNSGETADVAPDDVAPGDVAPDDVAPGDIESAGFEPDGPESGGPESGGPPFGPYDVDQAPRDDRQRFDLGALRIPAIAGVEIQLRAGPQGEIQKVQLAHAGSLLQLAAFAAPRTEGIWDEIRATLHSSLVSGGARPREVDGEYGPELCARVKDTTGTVEVRHVGIDGPRWFVHGVYLGAAATDPDQAGPLRDVLRGLVVDRGIEARPVSEALPLRLPAEAAAQLAEMAANPADAQAT